MLGGDFYAHQPKQDQRDQDIGPLKAFSRSLLLDPAEGATDNTSEIVKEARNRAILVKE